VTKRRSSSLVESHVLLVLDPQGRPGPRCAIPAGMNQARPSPMCVGLRLSDPMRAAARQRVDVDVGDVKENDERPARPPAELISGGTRNAFATRTYGKSRSRLARNVNQSALGRETPVGPAPHRRLPRVVCSCAGMITRKTVSPAGAPAEDTLRCASNRAAGNKLGLAPVWRAQYVP